MSISIEELNHSFDTHQFFEVTFFNDRIETLLTHTPSMVDSWIANIEYLHRHKLNSLIVGLDLEWRPSFDPTTQIPAAILQLCVGRNCLIFQLLHSPTIPPSLSNFLNNPDYTFVGVGIGGDVEKLWLDHGLRVSRSVDLRGLAASVLNRTDLENARLILLAREVLEKDVEKPIRVTLSRWDSEFLTHAQVQYACVDAFLSFEIGRTLFSRNYEV
ncbi:hypothetical protein HHK36_017047 [Tetracentron sinense]|uniref:3'-5' exonuclease domain-containing protein n=1 Tax=Tetracentron sinense TaxID=13715 RepID=A0A834Z718_TETSI|nr:hypothetical protein HHK36_017047 [Tetracentron sinense]